MARSVAIAALLLALGCGGEEGPTPSLRADIDALRLLMIQDPAHQPLEEVEAVVETRPVEAARRLRQGGLPAAREQVERAERLQVTTPEGQGWLRRLRGAYTDRLEALERYADVLEAGAGFGGGVSSDIEGLLSATHDLAQADLVLMAVDADMEDVVPVGRDQPEGAAPQGDDDPPPRAPGR